MTSLPDGWRRLPLADIARITLGQSPPGSSYNESGEGVPFFQGKAEFGDERPEVRKFTTSATKFADENDILLSVRAPVGPTNIAPLRCAIGRGLAAIKSHEGIDQRYLLWAMRATETDLAARSTGSTFGAVSGSVVRQHQINVAPLGEQRRIVEILEDHLSRLDAAQGLIVAAQRRLGRLRASAGHRLSTEGWTSRPLREVAHLITDGDHNPPKRVPSGIPHITAKGIRNGRISLDGCTYVSEDGFRQTAARYAPMRGDVIVTCVGTIGEVAVVPPGLVFSADRNLAGIRTDTSRVLPEYLALALSGHGLQQQMRSASSSTAQPHLYLRDLRDLPIPVPDVATQKRVIAEVATLDEESRALAGSVTLARRRAQLLRRSLLHAAFSGKIVAAGAPADLEGSRTRA